MGMNLREFAKAGGATMCSAMELRPRGKGGLRAQGICRKDKDTGKTVRGPLVPLHAEVPDVIDSLCQYDTIRLSQTCVDESGADASFAFDVDGSGLRAALAAAEKATANPPAETVPETV